MNGTYDKTFYIIWRILYFNTLTNPDSGNNREKNFRREINKKGIKEYPWIRKIERVTPNGTDGKEDCLYAYIYPKRQKRP